MKTRKLILKALSIISICFISLESRAQKLDSLINYALINNTEIQISELQYNRMLEKINEANTLPNTEFSAGYFVREPETRTGPQKFKLSVKQMIPWFGTITSQERYNEALAEVGYTDILITKKNLALLISQSYIELYTSIEKEKLLEEYIDLIETYLQMRLAAVGVGKATAVDVLRLEIEKNNLTQTLESIKQEKMGKKIILNKLLDRDANHQIVIHDNFTIPLDSVNNLNIIQKTHPELTKIDKQVDAINHRELVNLKNKIPKIGFGVDYVNVSERTDMDMEDNGKDIVMPMVSLSIPIFNRKFNSISTQNDLQLEELQIRRRDKLNTLESKLSSAITKQNTARISYKYNNENLNYLNKAEQILIKSYESEAARFTEILELKKLKLELALKNVEAINTYYKQKFKIDYLTSD